MAGDERVLPRKRSASSGRLRRAALAGSLFLAAATLAAGMASSEETLAPSRLSPAIDLRVQEWHGPAICYSGYRAGQHPDKGLRPSQAQVLEDMRILERHWRLIRMYGADRHTEDVVEVIRSEKINLKLMLGIWISGRAEDAEKNARQIETGIRLANAYSDVVVAVSVGNEALVSWSDHRISEERMLGYVEKVREAVSCPVTTDDDVLYWRNRDARLVNAVDFIALHTYPIWGGADIDAGLSGTVASFESVRKAHPRKTIVLGEVGWATYTVGDKHAPRAGDEVKQKRYLEELTSWARIHDVTAFFFEAFDEPWKGEGTEGHWGLFDEGRRAKLAVRELFPDLIPKGPTSPSYDAPQPVAP
jgi:exo-beta-1,3-glucanase (GH17 family)